MIGPPSARAVTASRDIKSAPDPLLLYAGLSDCGTRSGTIFFEQRAGPCLLLEAAALRIECRGQHVVLDALTENGANLLEHVEVEMARYIVRASHRHVRLEFPRLEADDAEERLSAPSPFDVLRQVTTALACGPGCDRFGVLALGVFAFDCVDLFEILPDAAEDPLGFPDFLFLVPESLVVFEPGKSARAVSTSFVGLQGTTRAVSDATARADELAERCSRLAKAPKPPVSTANGNSEIAVDLDDKAFAALVADMKAHVAAGEVYQIVASRTFTIACANPFACYSRLRSRDPATYNYFARLDPYTLLGASPETSVRISRDGGLHLELRPIAGTRRRGSTEEQDMRLEAELRLDPKEVAEHMMLVDLARNDVAQVSEAGSRKVTELLTVERFSKVMHLVSSVKGILRPGYGPIHALKACLNMGTLTGAPKIRATEILREAERTKRGPYGGTIGWLNWAGEMETAIFIRSAAVMDGCAFVRAGAGIVHDSDPRLEADETRAKASALLDELQGSGS